MGQYCECGNPLTRSDIFDGFIHCYTCRASFSLERTLPFEAEYYDQERACYDELDESYGSRDRIFYSDAELENAIEYNEQWTQLEMLEQSNNLDIESMRHLESLGIELISEDRDLEDKRFLAEEHQRMIEIEKKEEAKKAIQEKQGVESLVEKTIENAEKIGLPSADEI